MMSQIFTLCAGLFLLPILFRLALKLRLGIPMLYIVLALTVFHDWTRANPKLADGILFALVGLAALSWVVTGVRKVCGFIGQCWEGYAAEELFARRIRQAQANGEYAVSADDFWYWDHPSPISSRTSRSLILIAPTSTSILNKTSPT